MTMDATERHTIEAVVRTMVAASKTLRLYPPASPIPRQSMNAARAALDEYFASGAAVLPLVVGRSGFTCRGDQLDAGGGADLATELREHGIAELAIMPGVADDELLAFLTTAAEKPEDVRAQGGLGVLLATRGVESLRVVDVCLTVVEENLDAGPGQDFDEFLRELIADPVKLANWYAAASAGDPHTFGDSLMELARVAGPGGLDGLLGSLSTAFMAQDAAAKDVLLGLALEPGAVRDLTGGMFGKLRSNDIAGSVLSGSFGKNMLSLSSALSNLPLEQVAAQVRAEVQAMLPGAGHNSKEAAFLDHMMDVRSSREPEPALTDAVGAYRTIAAAGRVDDSAVAGARAAAGSAVDASAVRTILALLDQQRDFELYCASAENLGGMVPRLIERGDLPLAVKVVSELTMRQSVAHSPWPDLGGRVAKAVEAAVGQRSMTALVNALLADPSQTALARDIVRQAGEQGAKAFVAEAIAHKGPGIAIAEQVVGRHVIDLLNVEAAHAQWFQLAAIVSRLATEGDPRSIQTIEALMRRPDEQSRREVVAGLAQVDCRAASRVLGLALKDASLEVAVVAARALAQGCASGAAGLLGSRLDELDVDGDGFVLAREIIGALARVKDPDAEGVLKKLAARRALIKRGHFAEVQDLAQKALQLRTQGGVAR